MSGFITAREALIGLLSLDIPFCNRTHINNLLVGGFGGRASI